MTPRNEAENWLLELMEDYDFSIPADAFNELAVALALGFAQEPSA